MIFDSELLLFSGLFDFFGHPTAGLRMIAEELAALGWKEWELSSRRKNDPAKLALAARLRRETTWTPKQIATRLSLGTPKSATTALHRWMRNNPQALMESGALRRETGK